jgi:hypothetical protein
MNGGAMAPYNGAKGSLVLALSSMQQLSNNVDSDKTYNTITTHESQA